MNVTFGDIDMFNVLSTFYHIISKYKKTSINFTERDLKSITTAHNIYT